MSKKQVLARKVKTKVEIKRRACLGCCLFFYIMVAMLPSTQILILEEDKSNVKNSGECEETAWLLKDLFFNGYCPGPNASDKIDV